MDTVTWKKVRRIAEAASDCAPPRRARFLDRACRGDSALRQAVDELIGREPPDEDWLAAPVPGAATHALAWSGVLGAMTRIGRYRIDGVIAVGGMGIVLKAADDSAERPVTVAIKLLPPGRDSRKMLRAFRREQRLLDQLDHPNIGRILEMGTCNDGRPYFVMEYVDGVPIDEYVRTCSLPMNERLELFRAVCLAVHYAHQNLIVHRDLKPGNILVGAGGVIKLLDFGIAKLLTDQPAASATETMMDAMTPRYSSPEQIRGEPISTATDIYSLGVVLYELIAERLPYDLGGASRYEAERIISEQNPIAPSSAYCIAHPDQRLPRCLALDRIVAMAMHKEPRRRYASAEQLAEDIRRYLDGSTVMAYKAGRFERALTILRKHRIAFGVATASFVIISGLAVFSALSARSANLAREREARARQVSQKINGVMTELLALAGPTHLGATPAGLHVLEEASALTARELADQPEVAAGIHQQIGTTYNSLRRRSEAIRSYRQAIECYRRSEPVDRAKLADSLVSLGSALCFRDDEEGLPLQREALAIRRELFGEEHLLVAQSLHAVAFALTRCARPARYDEAEGLYRQALAMRQRLGAGESDAAAENLHAIAALLRHQGKLEASADQYEQALALTRRALPPLDTQLINCIEDYAHCLMDLGRLDRAEELLRESMTLNAQAMGEAATVVPLTYLVDVSCARGDHATAWRNLHLALARFGRTAMPQTGDSAAARWRALMGRFEAQPNAAMPEAYGEFIALAPVAYSPSALSPDLYASLLDQTAELLAGDGHAAMAERLARETLRTVDTHDPASKMTRVRYCRTLADALIGLGRIEEARTLLVDVESALRATRGPSHRETQTVARRLADLAAKG